MNYHTYIGIFRGAYWERRLLERGTYILKILLFGEALLLENGHTLDHSWKCRMMKVFITSFKLLTWPKLKLKFHDRLMTDLTIF